MTRYSRQWGWAIAVASVVAWPALSVAQDQGGEPWQQNQGNQQRDDQNQQDQQRREQERQQQEQQRQAEQQRRQQERQRQGSADNRGSEDAALGIALGRGDGQGARVERVFRDSAALEMGLREGDLVVAVNGQQVRSGQDLTREIQNQNPGDNVELEIERDGNRQHVSGRLETRQQAFEFRDSERYRPFGRESRRSWSDEGGYTSSGNYQGNQQNLQSQLNRLERQVAQIQRELENLRFAIDERGDQRRWSDDRESQSYSRGESNARYDDDSGRRMNQQTNFDRFDEQGSQRRPNRAGEIHPSSGGEVGEDRQQVDSSEIDRDW
jgi:hypothetical protein